MNLLLDRKMPATQCPEMVRLVTSIDKANPGARWTMRKERMGTDWLSDRFFLDGQPIFDITADTIYDRRTN
jgi:hypothetical protein